MEEKKSPTDNCFLLPPQRRKFIIIFNVILRQIVRSLFIDESSREFEYKMRLIRQVSCLICMRASVFSL